MSRTKFTMAAVLLTASGLLGGCASGFTTAVPTPPVEYKRLGSAAGSACGSIGILATAYNFVPMGLNDRVQRAYDAAVANVSDATALVDVTVQENWFWWFIGTARCVTITGEAVK